MGAKVDLGERKLRRAIARDEMVSDCCRTAATVRRASAATLRMRCDVEMVLAGATGRLGCIQAACTKIGLLHTSLFTAAHVTTVGDFVMTMSGSWIVDESPRRDNFYTARKAVGHCRARLR